ncbi:hypothetical protein ERO13_A12G070600v2 [Gossypium hirsutum]|uniref:Uncharacterized protein n=3 Tax=Gossypium TaxID=3633 RepID=A0A2P5YGF5_GOSBA|nr:uncharacterized protein LOC121203558 [Gossypium hirsutum]KAB2051703.1 hypothetical protein ES319_A12G072600v1 [Gossypium barbadense]KAG4169192.1 hypothetical protein ERO13_A12G070600v2 [Gossypium hirsutum]PPS14675.1 hypothetical protein GOBAR_AA05904 [Gossypium barbadense]TYG89169.1 hypothetical protein ES288_A12G078200v1 [Gossypium darwinii]
MACLEMYNNSEHKSHHHCAPMSPRISFSNEFVETQQITRQERSSREAPVSTDFEFSVSNYSMMSADELFYKGKLLPFKDTCSNHMQRTLREELLVEDDDNDNVTLSPSKGSTRWKGFLSLKRTHIGSKKANKSEGSVERLGNNTRRSGFVHEDTHVNKTSQDLLSEGGSSF